RRKPNVLSCVRGGRRYRQQVQRDFCGIALIRRYLSSDPLLPTVHKRFMISQFKDGLKSKLRSSPSCITLRMSPLGVAPQVSDHGFEGSTIPWPSSIAQGSKYLRQDIGWG